MKKNDSQYCHKMNCCPRSGSNYISCRIIAVAFILTGLIFIADNAYSEHDIQTYTFEFSGSAQPQATNQFISYSDGAFYLKLKSYTPSSSTTDKPYIGFRKPGQASCPDRYDSFVENAVIGTTYGPFYMEAETYESLFFLTGGASSYSMEIEYQRQLTPNDVEPNDTMETVQDIGALPPDEHITGHLGYLGCVHDKKDYQRFGVTTSGNYLFDIHFDSPFKEKAGCMVYFHLLDETTSTWLLSYTGPQDASALGPKYLDASHTYLMSMEASGCYDTISEGGGTFVVGNKAGAYDVTIKGQQIQPTDPFTITDLTVNPSTLYPGENMNGKVFIQNNKAVSSNKIELTLRVIRLSNNAEATSKSSSFFLAANELKIFEFSLSELMAPKELLSLTTGKYKIVAIALTRDSIGNVTANSSREVSFEIVSFDVNKNNNIAPIVNFLMRTKKK